jgi:hypothetical protein
MPSTVAWKLPRRHRPERGPCRSRPLGYPRAVEEAPCQSVELVGDGDEIAAIEEVEREFGVALPDEDAPHWRTAGDLFASLLEALPPEAAADPATWERFARALCWETGVDPLLISEASPLLLPDRGFWAGLKQGCVSYLWCLLVFLVLVFLFS